MQKHPRSIEELYEEAVAARAKYPEYAHGQLSPTFSDEGSADGIPPSPGLETGSAPKTPLGTVPAPGRAVRQNKEIIQVGASQSDLNVSGPRVSEIFEDTEVRQAIQVLATQAGVSVVIDDRVAGVTSAHIENESFDLALKKILLPLGFIYKKKDGLYLIGASDPQSAMFPQLAETLEFRPMHLAPAELMQLLPDGLKKYVQVIEKRNLMIIEAPEDVAQRIATRLEQSDRPVPQVILEAMVCVINPTRAFQFNVDAKQSLTVDGKELLNVGLTGLSFTGNATPFGLKNAFSDFALTSTFLRLLAQEGYVTIRAAPRVMAKDGEKATISIAKETFFAVTPENANVFFQSTLQQIDAGISLDIVPVVRGDTVTVNIEKAEVSEPIRAKDKTADLDSRFPLINRRRVATTVHVQDGQTIVIGGLVQRQTVDRVSRIPGIGDIPYLGRLFQYIDQEDAEAEVVIFIAPKIVNPPCADVPAAVATPQSPSLPHFVPNGRESMVPEYHLSPRQVPKSPTPDLSPDEGVLPPAPRPAAKKIVEPSPTSASKSTNNVPEVLPLPANVSTTEDKTATPAMQIGRPSVTSAVNPQDESTNGNAVQSLQSEQKVPPPISTVSPTSPSVPKTVVSQPNGVGSSVNSSSNSSDASNTSTRELRFIAPKVVNPVE